MKLKHNNHNSALRRGERSGKAEKYPDAMLEHNSSMQYIDEQDRSRKRVEAECRECKEESVIGE